MATISDVSARDNPVRFVRLPDLSSLRSRVVLDLAVNTVFRSRAPGERRSETLVIGFVRLVDKAVQEYEAARGMLDSYLSTRPRTFSFILRAVGHMEPCLNAVARAVRFVDALRSSRGGPRIPKSLSCLSSSAKGRIQGIRDAVEHMEERVLTDRIVSGEPVALVLEDGHVELATERISFVELSTWLKQLNNLAVTLASTPEFRHHDANNRLKLAARGRVGESSRARSRAAA